MACVAQKNPRDNGIRARLDDAAQNLLSLMNRTDGSFGSKYSTALAAQVMKSWTYHLMDLAYRLFNIS